MSKSSSSRSGRLQQIRQRGFAFGDEAAGGGDEILNSVNSTAGSVGGTITNFAAPSRNYNNHSTSNHIFTPPMAPRAAGTRSHIAAAAVAHEQPNPTIDPYVGKLERYELFCTNQAYYLVGCNKFNTAYRVLKMDRTLIERPLVGGGSGRTEGDTFSPKASLSAQQPQPQQPQSQSSQQPTQVNPSASNTSDSPSAVADAAHNSKPTLRPLSEFLTEDPNVYTQEEIQDMLDMIHDGNRLRREGSVAEGGGQDGGLKPIAKAYGIVGFIRFLDCYYLTLITRRAKVGSIGGNGIYNIKNTETFPIKPAERVPGSATDMDIHADPSSVLLNMWNRGKRSVGLGLTNREIAELRYQGLYQVVDLTKNFFFSYTYDLTRSLQENFLSNTSKPFPPPPFKDMFAWNYFLTRELEGCCHSMSSFHWVMPIIHGAFVQRKLNDYGRSLNVTLLARRSRHFAGTRYLKRGVSEQGKCANDVEHEQVVHDESKSATNGIFSSFLQVRASIPTFWTQESSVTMPKPPIEMTRVDPSYAATQLHFEDLMKRYGGPIVVLDLVKQSEKREREVRVGNEFRHAIDYINTSIDDDHKIRYCALDYSHISKHRHLDVSTSLKEVSTWAVNQTGFFCSSPQWKITQDGSIEPFTEQDMNAASILPQQLGVPVFPMEQTGILRTNCIDCLDRTNVAQFSAGVEAMEQQLVVMGIRSSPKLDPSSNVVRVLIDMYVDIGDHIALQYGGSEAHKKVSAERSESIVGPIGKHKELLTSIRRYYSNAFTDRLKQDAMNLFLGYYVPYRHTIPLWEMETDYYLHNFHARTGRGISQSMREFQMSFGVLNWNDDEDEKEGEGSLRTFHHRTHSRFPTLTDFAGFRQEDQIRRIQKVRNRCTSQNEALSVWWKIALQSNVQQRMWMKLGNSPVETVIPPRFDRLYQPEKMAQFDRFFARPWATPVRRSHSAQHNSETDDDTEIAVFRRNISGVPRRNHETDSKNQSTGEGQETPFSTTLESFVADYGLGSHIQALPTPASGTQEEAFGKGTESNALHSYIGDIGTGSEKAQHEYEEYVSPQDDNSSPFRRNAFEEFKDALDPLSLGADDVGGIRKLAESAHIGRKICCGPYKGLRQDTSAIEVATVVQEQFNAYEKMRNRGELREGIALMDSELKRRGLYTEGVKGAISSGWNRRVRAEKHYSESFLEPSQRSTRSALSTTNSLQLYSSFYPHEKEMTTTDLAFIVGDQAELPQTKTKPGHVDLGNRPSTFVTRAKRFGVPITSHSELIDSRNQPLFQFDQRKEVPAGFEMINEDFFARKDNKFMVFNGAGVDSWRGTEPVTKISGVDKMLSGTLC